MNHPFPAQVEIIAEIYRDKLAADARGDARGRPRLPLAPFVTLFFRRKFGDRRTVRKKYKAFVIGVTRRLEDGAPAPGEDPVAIQWITLFAQLCGIETPSGRVAGLPPAACDYCLDKIHAVEPAVRDTLKALPHDACSIMLKKMVNGRNAFLLGCGFLEKVEPFFKAALRNDLKLRPRDEVYATVLGTLRSHAAEVTVTNVTRKVVSVPALMSLYAVVYTACDSPKFERTFFDEAKHEDASPKKGRASAVKPMY